MNYGKELVLIFWEKLIATPPKVIDLILQRELLGILPHIVHEAPLTGACTLYTDANKSGKAGYKLEELSKVEQRPYNSVQKAELYAILMVLRDFKEPLNIVTDLQYAELFCILKPLNL